MSRMSCKFFARGSCRRGADCPYLHETPVPSVAPTPGGYNGPLVINIQPGVPIFSIDVECAATSKGHNGRSVCSIGMVDEFQRPLLNILIKEDPANPVVSYLTELTGVTKEITDTYGVPLDEGIAAIRAMLSPHAVLVGQNILKDVNWLGLKEGVDYGSLIDLSDVFRVWNTSLNSWTNFSQDHVARVWLQVPARHTHNALDDAGISMALFNAYRSLQWQPDTLFHMQMATLHAERLPSYAATNGQIDGCCLGHRRTCICSDPFFIS